jgi:DtxR family Mn-dependent transcriptional regulator
MLSKNEEDYLKALYYLEHEQELGKVSGRTLASHLDVSSASVTEMLKKLKSKALVDYEKYGKLSLSKSGLEAAVTLIRKHRLWETFLHGHMNFSWDEVHDVAEQLEHIQSKKLILELERFLEFPSHDPHGDPIPDANGKVRELKRSILSSMPPESKCRLIAINDSSTASLMLASDLGLSLRDELYVSSVSKGGEVTIRIGERLVLVPKDFSQNVFVELIR